MVVNIMQSHMPWWPLCSVVSMFVNVFRDHGYEAAACRFLSRLLVEMHAG